MGGQNGDGGGGGGPAETAPISGGPGGGGGGVNYGLAPTSDDAKSTISGYNEYDNKT